jgi:DNA-directed RNA polymerase subunit L
MDKITIKILSHENNRLELNIRGVNNTIVNCIRRVAMSSVPIYSFNNIIISENTSIFNNNYMKLRLRNMPVYGIMSDTHVFTKKEKDKVIEEETNIEIANDIDTSAINILNSSSLKQLTMYLDYTNNTTDIVTVGTDDCKFYYMEKQIESPYKMPLCGNIPIIKLQPKQKIKLSAITELGIEDMSAIYSPVSIFTFKINDELDYDISVESRGQLDEMKILHFALLILCDKLDNFINLIPDNNNISGKLLLDNSDHTLGTIIAEGLQNNKKIKFAGYNMPHPLENKVLFHYDMYKEDNIRDILMEVVTHYKKIFNNIKKLL